jgi:DNA polymerase-4
LNALAHNRDPRPVRVGRRRGSIGSQRALGRSPKSSDTIDAVLVGLVDRVARRMRAARRVGRTVVLRLRFDDFSRATRSYTLPWATAHTPTLLGAARGLLVVATPLFKKQGLTCIGVAVSNLDNDDAVQLALPFDRGSNPPSTPRSTPFASASAATRSRAPSTSAATRAYPCQCSPTSMATTN